MENILFTVITIPLSLLLVMIPILIFLKLPETPKMIVTFLLIVYLVGGMLYAVFFHDYPTEDPTEDPYEQYYPDQGTPGG